MNSSCENGYNYLIYQVLEFILGHSIKGSNLWYQYNSYMNNPKQNFQRCGKDTQCYLRYFKIQLFLKLYFLDEQYLLKVKLNYSIVLFYILFLFIFLFSNVFESASAIRVTKWALGPAKFSKQRYLHTQSTIDINQIPSNQGRLSILIISVG